MANLKMRFIIEGIIITALAMSLLAFFTTICHAQEGIASWYSKNDPTDPWIHKTTASGELFDEEALTCAMASRDFGKYYKITNLKNNKAVIVKHNDYNPFKKYKGRDMSDRIIDLSKAAFSKIADLRQGLIEVKVEKYQE